MASQVTLGGDRLGSGKKQKVELHGFERSTHDLGYVWRNTQAPGTLVPFMVQLALPGDTFDIDLQADVKTHPTLGPLFASFKLQLDVFECPIRLYHGWLHNNKLKIGNDMSTVKLPIIEFNCNPLIFGDYQTPLEFQQINQSSIFAYLGIRGVGQGEYANTYRTFNAVPWIAYWDIYKNYYANKMEEVGYVIHQNESITLFDTITIMDNAQPPVQTYFGQSYDIHKELLQGVTYTFTMNYFGETPPPQIFAVHRKNSNLKQVVYRGIDVTNTNETTHYHLTGTWTPSENVLLTGISEDVKDYATIINDIKLQSFPLIDIDNTREEILKHDYSSPYSITENEAQPFYFATHPLQHPESMGQLCCVCSQEGLGIKTYQSDIFNNWLNTEWIDGGGGINDISKVSTAGDSFTIDSLNLAQKVYDMLNRIAVSGGTYEDWLNAVYDHESFRRCETPMYHGGLSKEIIFQEVVGLSETYDFDNGESKTPLGSLAGRGILSNKHKGGKITIKVNEPSYIIGIVSITPRIDYYQGNEFFVNHTSINDLHKPSLDEIGFQELVTDKMAFWDTTIENELPVYKSAGKQPAWLDYMTNYNRVYGNFADERSEMFMTLTRRYTPDEQNLTIQDLTTYIDPTKYNYAFAQTDLTAQNFWVQIGVDMIARRKMSAKLMPNL